MPQLVSVQIGVARRTRIGERNILTAYGKQPVAQAVELARACAKPGDIIILSPASASFDLYPNFEVRGREFKSIVNALK